mmetsp:Transcript_8505/g.18097  ORF Transcript_8505/g.18097 Transcript_8505/m.18097 type:complete len:204 (+) Transcript_8505:116-727(+)
MKRQKPTFSGHAMRTAAAVLALGSAAHGKKHVFICKCDSSLRPCPALHHGVVECASDTGTADTIHHGLDTRYLLLVLLYLALQQFWKIVTWRIPGTNSDQQLAGKCQHLQQPPCHARWPCLAPQQAKALASASQLSQHHHHHHHHHRDWTLHFECPQCLAHAVLVVGLARKEMPSSECSSHRSVRAGAMIAPVHSVWQWAASG